MTLNAFESSTHPNGGAVRAWSYWTQSELLSSLKSSDDGDEAAGTGGGGGHGGGGGGGSGGGSTGLATSCASYIAAAVERTDQRAIVDGNVTVGQLVATPHDGYSSLLREIILKRHAIST